MEEITNTVVDFEAWKELMTAVQTEDQLEYNPYLFPIELKDFVDGFMKCPVELANGKPIAARIYKYDNLDNCIKSLQEMSETNFIYPYTLYSVKITDEDKSTSDKIVVRVSIVEKE